MTKNAKKEKGLQQPRNQNKVVMAEGK